MSPLTKLQKHIFGQYQYGLQVTPAKNLPASQPAPIPMVWTMRGPAATQSSEEYSYHDLLRSDDPPCFAKHLNEKPQIIALLISFFPLLCIPPMVNKMLLNAAIFLLI